MTTSLILDLCRSPCTLTGSLVAISSLWCVWLHFSSTVRRKCMSAICLAVMSLPLCSVPCVAFTAFVGFNFHVFPIHGGTFGADDHDAGPHLDINGDSHESRLEDAVARIMEEDDVDHLPGPPLNKQEHAPQLKY